MTGNVRDLITGGVLALTGIFFCIRSLDYPLGTIRQMGPGYFPLALGILLVIIASAIMTSAFFRSPEPFEIEWRAFFSILASVAVFALAFRYLGLVPAVFFSVVVAACASPQSSLRGILILAVMTALSAWLLFPVLLELPMPPFAGFLRWNF